MLESGGDDMHLPVFFAQFRSRADRLVVCLASAGCEKDLARFRANRIGHIFARFFQYFFRLLSKPVQAGRIAPGVVDQGNQFFGCCRTHFCGGSIVSIDHDGVSFRFIYSCDVIVSALTY